MTFEIVTNMLTTGHTSSLEITSIFYVTYPVCYTDIRIKEINTVNINLRNLGKLFTQATCFHRSLSSSGLLSS